ncbi:hypothetical protein KHA96_18470 [Bacillus sp. FJAT-49711]|uniref:hypothetical protein n=1 Tax=Bacillus sp. FJAT-49711 TaxID=2833585 RepID=UPI001BC980EC|nr:hypothetical protein [Bacillus sp. FJAT-49711]MBS4220290.1 hypothetical protein [Bacillus sp. FJAT-49711]
MFILLILILCGIASVIKILLQLKKQNDEIINILYDIANAFYDNDENLKNNN